MRKIFIVCSLLAVISAQALAADSSANTEDFFYQRGYESGYNKGFSDGVKRAFIEAKAVLQKYKDQLLAYEIGKYLLKSSYITYPQIWQERTSDGEVRLKISPSVIEKPLNIDELFSKFSTLPLRDGAIKPSLELSLEERNSVYLSDRDSNHNDLTQSVDESIKTITIQVAKSAKNLDTLKAANVVFSDEGDSYNILFFSNSEKKEFCENYNLCK